MRATAEQRAAFGLALRIEREATGLTQSQLGDRLGVTGSAVGQWESGLTLPEGPAELFALEGELDVPPGRLSHHLGFVPAEAPEFDVVAAIEADPRLTTAADREHLVDLYRTVVRWSQGRQRPG